MHSLVATGGPKPPNDTKTKIAIVIGVIAFLWIGFGPSIVMLFKD